MKDQLIALLEAVRLSRAALARYAAPKGRSAGETIRDIAKCLNDPEVASALAALDPQTPDLTFEVPTVNSPSISTDAPTSDNFELPRLDDSRE
jgi:hypothetical protein